MDSEASLTKNKNKKLTRILSIDGGGIRGILPAQVLLALENKLRLKTGKEVRIADYFDLVAGTSTGGILGCVLLCPDPNNMGKPRFGAKDALGLYIENGDKIFDIPFKHKLRTFQGVLDEKYPSSPLEEILRNYLGELKLSELIKPTLISAYDVKRGRPHFFCQHRAKAFAEQGNFGYDFYVRDVARATSAAPTYFEASNIFSLSDVNYPLIDGGVFANNPALCAYAEARKLNFGPEKNRPAAAEMFIFSIGTGNAEKSYEYKSVKDWGLIQWVKPLIEVMMNGVSQTVDYQLYQIYDAVEQPNNYVRINPLMGDAKTDMDDASKTNIRHLAAAGVETAEKYDTVLEKVADILLANE